MGIFSNISNKVENYIIAIVTAIIVLVIMGVYNNIFVVQPLRNELAANREAIIELAKIEKYKIENKFDKLKAKDGTITLDVNNELDAVGIDVSNTDSLHIDKKTFFDKLKFWK